MYIINIFKFGLKKKLVNLMICGSPIKTITHETHLGHVFQDSYVNNMNLINFEQIIRDMKVRTNAIISQFRPISWKSKVKLFNSQCLYLYGCPLWRLDDPKINDLCTTWKVCSRKLLDLNQRTRSRFIHQIMDTPPLIDTIMYRMLNFYINGLNSSDPLISNLFKNVLMGNTSYMRVNINKILAHFKIKYLDLFSLNKRTISRSLHSNIGEKEWQCIFMEELLSLRDGVSYVEFDGEDVDLTRDDIKLMLDQVSTD